MGIRLSQSSCWLKEEVKLMFSLCQMRASLPCYLCGSGALFRHLHLSFSDFGTIIILSNGFYSIAFKKYTQGLIYSSFLSFLLLCSSETKGFKNVRQVLCVPRSSSSVLCHRAHPQSLGNLSPAGRQMTHLSVALMRNFATLL